MKLTLITALLTLSCAWGQTTQEIGIDKIFVIPEGFDSNDQIQLVIDSTMPDACYKVGETKYSIEGTTIFVRQFIIVKRIMDCLPLQRNFTQFPKVPVRYTKILNIGSLKEGTYTVKYENQLETLKQEQMKVKKASMNTIDDFYYAPVSSAFTPELIYTDQTANVVLTGIINNSCMIFDARNIEVKKIGHIFIVMPKVRFSPHQDQCSHVERPLQAVIELGKISEEGRYLVHVRSMSGQATNKTFLIGKRAVDRGSHSDLSVD